jgi:hypothetical protein
VAQAGSLQSRDPAAAERAFQRGLELAPNYATGWQWYAEFFSYDQGQPERSMPLLQKAAKLDPLAPAIRAELARGYLRLGKTAEAEKLSDELIAKYPQFSPGYSLKADITRAHNDLVGTLRALEQRIAADPSSTRARGERCQALLGNGALAEAKACALALKGSTGLGDWQPTFDFQLAMIEGDLARAEAVVEGQARPQPWQRALVFRQTGRQAQALELYRAYLPQLLANPLGKPNLSNLFDADDIGAALNGLGRREQAATLLRYGLAATEGRPRAGFGGLGFSRTYAFALLGEFDRACADLESAAKEGYFLDFLNLPADRDLIELRKQACFAPAYARIKAAADKQVALARKAGLL